MKDIDAKLLEILISNCEKSGYVHNIRYLLNADVLSKEEEKICFSIFKHIEFYGNINVPAILTQLSYNVDEIENIPNINYAEMFVAIDKLIQSRRDEENKKLMQNALDLSSSQLYTGEMLDTFFNRYSNSITVGEDNDFEALNELGYTTEPITISSANEYIDNLIGGIEVGKLTTIVGGYDYYKSIWAINIAYKSLKELKNVLYISLGANREEVYKRFLSRHSCDSKFGCPISVEEMSKEPNLSLIDAYERIYNDFDAVFRKHLVVFDEGEFIINSHYNLQKLIVYAQKQFIEKSGEGIDVIIIDDFSNMKLDNGKRSITNKSTIINEYYKYLRNQANNLLGTGKSINVITTIHAINNFEYFFTNSYDFTLDFINDEVIVLSDYIFTIYTDKELCENNKAKIKMLKAYNNVAMEQSKFETLDYEHWCLKYAPDNNDDEASKDEKIETLLQENKRLNKDVANQSQTIMDMMTNKSEPDPSILDEMLKSCGLSCK